MDIQEALLILGAEPDASAEDIKRRYRQFCSKHHPDKPGGSTLKIQEGNRAFAVLKQTLSKTCPICGGSGHITKREGAFVRKDLCPRCWR